MWFDVSNVCGYSRGKKWIRLCINVYPKRVFFFLCHFVMIFARLFTVEMTFVFGVENWTDLERLKKSTKKSTSFFGSGSREFDELCQI